MTAFPTYPGLDTAVTVALTLFYLLCSSGIALLAGFIWRRWSSCRRGPFAVLLFAFVSSLLALCISLVMCVLALSSGFYRGRTDLFSMAFWPSTSGAIAIFAFRQLRRLRSTTDARSKSLE